MLFDRFYDVFVEFLKKELRVVAVLIRSLSVFNPDRC